MFDLIAMGSSTVDAFLSTDSEFIEIKTKTSEEELIAYPLGSKIMVNELRYDVGGNGVKSFTDTCFPEMLKVFGRTMVDHHLE